MKIAVIQPKYSTCFDDVDNLFKWQLSELDLCDDSLDIIVMPESCDIPALAKNNEQVNECYDKYNEILLKKAQETAKRCKSVLFINALYKTKKGFKNTTFAINKQGKIVGKYFKQHPTNGEVFQRKYDCKYSYEYSDPYLIEIDNVKYCFLTCYDFYFYELYSFIAIRKPDIIIGCSHQRSDPHETSELFAKFLAYNTNAYVIRSSVSMDENSSIGGGSLIAKPDGTILFNMKSKVGTEIANIDINEKFYKPAGFNNPPTAHFEYMEIGRRPWKYRPAGSAICLPDKLMPYPRVCAHRGYSNALPENTLPSLASAIALGAHEIEFDLWETKDREIVSIHDKTLDRVSNGFGNIYDYTLEELKELDFSNGYEKLKGLKIATFEEILAKFSCHVIMNIHVKTLDFECTLDESYLRKIISLIRKYNCEEYVYFMCGNFNVLKQLKKLAPDIALCVGAGDNPYDIVNRAIELGCQKVQLFKPFFNQEMINKALKNNIICNVFYSDDEQETIDYLSKGIHTILTNDFLKIYNVVVNTPKL